MTFQDVPSDQWRRYDGNTVVEVPPKACPNGHPYKPGRVTVSWLPCSCAGTQGHRTYECLECGAVLYRPAHVDRSGETVYQPRL